MIGVMKSIPFTNRSSTPGLKNGTRLAASRSACQWISPIVRWGISGCRTSIRSSDPSVSARLYKWDVAIRDLATVVAIDADSDGRVTFGEVRAAYPAIKQAAPNVAVLAGSLVGSNGAFLRATPTMLDKKGPAAREIAAIAKEVEHICQSVNDGKRAASA